MHSTFRKDIRNFSSKDLGIGFSFGWFLGNPELVCMQWVNPGEIVCLA